MSRPYPSCVAVGSRGAGCVMSGKQQKSESQILSKIAAINSFKARCRLEAAALRDDLRVLLLHGRFRQASACEVRLELIQRLAQHGPIGA